MRLNWIGGAAQFRSAAFIVLAATVGGGFACSSTFSGEGTPLGDGASETSTDASIGDVATSDAAPNDSTVGFDLGSIEATPSVLTIIPSTATLDVHLDDGVLSASTEPFEATLDGTTPLSASWTLDRGDLGAIATTGVFSANGVAAGVVHVTASYGGSLATATLTVNLHATQKAGGTAVGDGTVTAGGYGGVGGDGPGLAAPGDLVTVLSSTTPTAPSATDTLTWLYPYDKTVFPRGILAPLMQWSTNHDADGVRVQLSETGYDFDGFYAFDSAATSLQRARQLIDSAAWTQATESNTGDALHVVVTIASGGVAYGPIAEDWTIASGVLKGTVYYNSYNTALNPASDGSVLGGVLAIQPGALAPTLAIPSLAGKCHVCHEVSADGSTLFTNDTSQGDYGYGGSYDLTKAGAVIKQYYPGALPSSADIIGKYTYSGVYPDGTFVLASSEENFHAYQQSSDFFSRDTLLSMPSTGFTSAVTRAVTPSFSPDGHKVAFNFWAGSGDGVTTAGNGHSLAVMDFDCGAATGSITCGTAPFTLSGLREVYADPARYAGWPAFFPDASALIFQSTINGSSSGSVLNTYEGGTAELMIADPQLPAAYPPAGLCALNGYGTDCATSYLPVSTEHPNDTIYNYEPTVNPIVSGGYVWVVFTTRRAYGNVAQGDPYEGNQYTPIDHPITKKLWVAAIDLSAPPGTDPSHPAFYLPGQELDAGNTHGFWVVDPCKSDGSTCATGDECCGGYCRSDGDGGLTCNSTPPTTCANVYDKCTTNADCCGAASGTVCIDDRCTAPGIH